MVSGKDAFWQETLCNGMESALLSSFEQQDFFLVSRVLRETHHRRRFRDT